MGNLRAPILAVVMAASLFAGHHGQAADRTGPGDFNVVLLGTGTPQPFKHRFGPATLVIAGGKYLLFDAGRGITQQLWELRVPLGRIDHLFLTHLHSDHVVGIPDLWLTGWLRPPWGRRQGPFAVSGPEGTVAMMSHLEQAYAWDIKTRIADEKLPARPVSVAKRDIRPGVAYHEGGVKVIAFEVDHGGLVEPAYGYRIEYGGRTVAISGDTRFSENLIKSAAGVDVLIHAVAAARPALRASAPHWQRILAHHTAPEDVGRVFARTQPKLAVLYHLVILTDGRIKPPTMNDVIARTRQTYSGPLVVGKDLMIIRVGKSGVEVAKR